MANEELELKKLELQREQLELERKKAQQNQGFLNKHLGAIITAIVSLTAVFVSLVQLQMSDDAKQRELNFLETQKNNEMQLQELQIERQWKLNIVDFISEHRNEIFEGSKKQRKNIRQVMLVAFPPEVTLSIFEQASQSAPEEQRDEWKESEQTASKLIDPRIFIHILTEDQRPRARQVKTQLEQLGYKVPGIEQVDAGPINSEIRFFKNNESEKAQDISSNLRSMGFPVALQDLSNRYENSTGIRPWHYELWFGEEF